MPNNNSLFPTIGTKPLRPNLKTANDILEESWLPPLNTPPNYSSYYKKSPAPAPAPAPVPTKKSPVPFVGPTYQGKLGQGKLGPTKRSRRSRRTRKLRR